MVVITAEQRNGPGQPTKTANAPIPSILKVTSKSAGIAMLLQQLGWLRLGLHVNTAANLHIRSSLSRQ